MYPPPDDRVDLIPFQTSDGVDLFLRRGRHEHKGPAVLLLHGGSASCDTFMAPRPNSLFDFLSNHCKFDVWMLDWRGSHWVTETDPARANDDMEAVARLDIPNAIDIVLEHRKNERIREPSVAVLGHCLGAACVSIAMGLGTLDPAHVHRVVLATIGLFYEVTWDGWAKVQDRVLDRVADQFPDVQCVSPDVTNHPWPPEIEATYKKWPCVWGPPGSWRTVYDGFFKRLAFMFGQPFLVSNLHSRMTQQVVRKQFGAIPFKIFQHAGQNALRGFAAPLNAETYLDPDTPNDVMNHEIARAYLCPHHFREFDITLLTGADNPLWHRDSIDRMAEWLRRIGNPAKKYVLEGYGHQDLWWGEHSERDVFPLVCEALRNSRLYPLDYKSPSLRPVRA